MMCIYFILLLLNQKPVLQSEHQDLLQRVKNIVEEASWKLNIAPSATVSVDN